MCSSPAQSIVCPRSWRVICNFFAGWYSPMSSNMTVLLFCPTTVVVIFCASIKMVSRVCHSFAGAAIRGEAPTRVNGMGLLIVELQPDHTVMSVLGGWSSSASPLVIALVKLRPRSHVKSCLLMFSGSWSLVHTPNWGKVGPTGSPGGTGHSSKVVTDSGSCLIERRHWSSGSTVSYGATSPGSCLW